MNVNALHTTPPPPLTPHPSPQRTHTVSARLANPIDNDMQLQLECLFFFFFRCSFFLPATGNTATRRHSSTARPNKIKSKKGLVGRLLGGSNLSSP